MKARDRKLIIIGLDGLPKNLLNHFLELGLLPHIGELMTKEQLDDLESTIPPLTGPAWITLATGKSPLEHGCFGFTLSVKELDKTKTITSENIRLETFYEKLEEKNIKSILVNLPGSYPPRSEQITITSLLTQGDNFFFPQDKAEKYQKILKNYRLVPNPMIPKTSDKYLQVVSQIEKTRFQLAKKLFQNENWQLFFFLFSGTDWIMHVYYDKLIKSPKPNKFTKIFKEADQVIGWFMKNKPDNSQIIILSDHGFKTYKGAFYVNTWLRNEGYLKTTSQFFSDTPHERHQLEKEKIAKKRKLKLDLSFLQKLVAKNEFIFKNAKKIYKKYEVFFPVKLNSQEKPNLNQTKAYYHSGTMGIYINDDRFNQGIVKKEEKTQLIKEIISKLKRIKDPKEKKSVFKRVIINDSSNQEVHYPQPDIIFEFGDFWPKADMGPLFLYETLNNHSKNGIAIYPKSWHKIRKLTNIAPTVLKYFQT
jgi:predicted AlkP superfamily phosphohydrolase/phosphomutase